MTKPRAVIDIVGAETRAHQFLEQIRLFIGSLGAPETGQRARAVLVTNFPQPRGGPVQGFLPGCVAEDFVDIVRIDRIDIDSLGHVFTADQWLRQPPLVIDVIETVAALNAKTLVIGRPVAAIDEKYLVVLDVVSKLTADPAIWAD